MSFSPKFRTEGLFMMRGFCLLFYIVALTASNSVDEFNLIDYSNLHKMISQVNLAKHSHHSCKALNISLPASLIMFTYTSHESIELLVTQQESMDFWLPGLKACLNTKFIVICTDKTAEAKCKDLPHVNCAFVDFSKARESEKYRSSYSFFTYMKHELMSAVMQSKVDIFYFDLDMLILKDPWSNLDDIIESNMTYVNYPIHDILFQQNCGFAGGKDGKDICDRNGADVNSGQMFIRYSPKVQHYFDYIKSHKNEIILPPEGSRTLDQDFVGRAALAADLSVCGLNKWHYTSICQAHNCKSNDDASFRGIVTLHVDCIGGGTFEKNKRLRKYLSNGKANPDGNLGQITIF